MSKETVPFWTPEVPEPDHTKAASLAEANKAAKEADRERKWGTLWQCVGQIASGKGCGVFARVDTTHGIQTHYYVQPYSCTGGDYWLPGELHLVCPSCGKRNRLYSEQNKKDAERLGPYLASVTDEHKE